MAVEQHRLAAIIAVDVADFRRLIDAQKEETMAVLRSHRDKVIDPLLARFEGRLANAASESLLIEFTCAVDAVRCAAEVQKAIDDENVGVPEDRRLFYRIGVHVGDVVTRGNILAGDGVKVVAGLQGSAEAGGICMSQIAHAHVRDRLDIDLRDVGEIKIKNIARPVQAFQVLNEGVITPFKVKRFANGQMLIVGILVAVFAMSGGLIWIKFQGSLETAKADTSTQSLSDDPSQQ